MSLNLLVLPITFAQFLSVPYFGMHYFISFLLCQAGPAVEDLPLHNFYGNI